MNQDRRAFLKTTGWTAAGSGLYIMLAPLSVATARTGTREHMYAFVVDTTKCIGCGKCVEACTQENHVPDGYFRTWVERYTVTRDGHVRVDSPKGAREGFPPLDGSEKDVDKSFFVPKLCNHCASPNCVQVCPVGATYVSKEGFVLVDGKQCIGCSYCVQACPYGARYVDHHGTGTADKCTWCYHRVKKGLDPACVTVCPTGARMFGRIDDPQSTVYDVIKTARLQVLKPETGNNPMAFYVGLDKEVR